jgi:hypothetical protein
MTKTFDPTKPVRYVDGNGMTRPARIISTDRKCELYPIIALVTMEDGYEMLFSFVDDGWDEKDRPDRAARLENIPEKRKLWLNVYHDNVVFVHKSRECADRGATNGLGELFRRETAEHHRMQGNHRIACVEVEFEEGEGL